MLEVTAVMPQHLLPQPLDPQRMAEAVAAAYTYDAVSTKGSHASLY